MISCVCFSICDQSFIPCVFRCLPLVSFFAYVHLQVGDLNPKSHWKTNNAIDLQGSYYHLFFLFLFLIRCLSKLVYFRRILESLYIPSTYV